MIMRQVSWLVHHETRDLSQTKWNADLHVWAAAKECAYTHTYFQNDDLKIPHPQVSVLLDQLYPFPLCSLPVFLFHS